MKIVLFTNSLEGGGAERAAATLANFWAGQGWEVTLLTLSSQDADFYRLDARVGRIALHLSDESGNVLQALWLNLRRVKALRRTLLQLQPDVALSLMSTPNVLLAFAARRLPGLAAIGSEHDYPPHAPLGSIWTALRSAMYGRLAAVVALTQETARWLGSNSSARRIAVIPNATVWPLPKQAPSISPASLVPAARKVLLAVGRLTTVKNFNVLIEAFSSVAIDHGDWDLVILGEGPQRAALEAAIGARGLDRRILMPGIAGNVGDWYELAKLYVMTSRSEGFPNTLAEALAHGLPAVSVDCDTGPRDIVRHEIDGLLVPPEDSPALVAALDRLMGDADLRAAMGARAVDARQRFSVEHVSSRWEQLFNDLRRPRLALTAPSQAPTASR